MEGPSISMGGSHSEPYFFFSMFFRLGPLLLLSIISCSVYFSSRYIDTYQPYKHTTIQPSTINLPANRIDIPLLHSSSMPCHAMASITRSRKKKIGENIWCGVERVICLSLSLSLSFSFFLALYFSLFNIIVVAHWRRYDELNPTKQ